MIGVTRTPTNDVWHADKAGESTTLADRKRKAVEDKKVAKKVMSGERPMYPRGRLAPRNTWDEKPPGRRNLYAGPRCSVSANRQAARLTACLSKTRSRSRPKSRAARVMIETSSPAEKDCSRRWKAIVWGEGAERRNAARAQLGSGATRK